MLQVNRDLQEYKVEGFLAKQEMMATAQFHKDSCRIQVSTCPVAGLERPTAAVCLASGSQSQVWGVIKQRSLGTTCISHCTCRLRSWNPQKQLSENLGY